ncbi:MAG: hypothetical protein QOH29_457 [Actinomycetota bacterium]|jgi:very-short-patch-repair endonuclease|nr:hypothetical protein [Actinomycetota bacterium]
MTDARPRLHAVAADGDPADLEWLLELQAGVASTAQLLARGVTLGRIRAQVAAGRWQRIHPRVVVAHGGPRVHMSRAWAAVLWAGEESMLSHDTAGYLLRLLDREPSEVHVAISEQRRLVAPVGVVLHRTSHLDGDPRRHPPQTTIERTTLDLVSTASTADEVVAVVAKVLQARMTSEGRLIDALSHTPNLRWKRLLGELLDPQLDGVRSPLEWRYASNVERAHGLPRPRRQVVVARAGSKTIRDIAYEEFGVVVELDGRIGHREGHAFRDMARDNRTAEMGEITLRYGWVDVTTRPCLVADQVGRVLVLRGWDGRPQACRPGCLAGRR